MNPFEPIGVAAMGYAWQWTRAPKNVPNWLGYVIFGGLSIAVWYWVTPDAAAQVAGDWRSSVLKIVMLGASARGISAISAETGLAAKTDSK